MSKKMETLKALKETVGVFTGHLMEMNNLFLSLIRGQKKTKQKTVYRK